MLAKSLNTGGVSLVSSFVFVLAAGCCGLVFFGAEVPIGCAVAMVLSFVPTLRCIPARHVFSRVITGLHRS